MTVSGMTGFCRREGAAGDWTWAVEARSVNGRNLDLRFRGPPGFDALERLAREAAQARFQRGQITVGSLSRRMPALIRLMNTAAMRGRSWALAVSFSTIDARITA